MGFAATPTLDGNAIFGLAVRMQHSLQPAVYHKVAFFGINGQSSVFGGTRGRLIEVEGLLAGQDITSLNLAEGTFETYIDGLVHILSDTRGRTWQNVIFEGDMQVSPEGPRPLVGFFNNDGSQWWGIRYKAAFLALV